MMQSNINALRKLMKKHKIQAYLVPSTDPHQSEYIPVIWERRKWLSGFTGSAGDLVITVKSAGLWTDSRYYLQAEDELKGSDIQLFKVGLPETPSIQEWLKLQLKAGDRVGIDPKVISYQDAKKLQDYISSWKIILKPVDENLVDQVWKEKPKFPSYTIQVQPIKYAGESIKEKLGHLREQMRAEKVYAHLITTLDTIAWLFNIRGRDVDYNPVVVSYAIITEKKAYLFTQMNKITKEVKKHFGSLVKYFDYHDFDKHLTKLAKSKVKVWLDSHTVNWWIVNILEKKCELFFKESPITKQKAIKNKKEIEGFKTCHIRDGVAMVKFLHWLEKIVEIDEVSEISASEKLDQFRSEQEFYQGPSFHPISAFAQHGAIVHYASTPETDVKLQKPGIYLIDSGGQYLDGTTDITRTIALGESTNEQKDRFTRILKGHIQLTMSRFPRGTAGNQLDTIARKPLWDIGLNYGHGTGHGIGAYLNVHEGPQAISFYRGIGVPLEPGMILSNEPGFYKAGEYGMRVENLILTVIDNKHSNDKKEFYTFETITLCPIDLQLIDKTLLDDVEINWLNKYHQRVRNVISPFLKDAEREWLNKATNAI